jgi:dolichol-phosphate mannosyltransferase
MESTDDFDSPRPPEAASFLPVPEGPLRIEAAPSGLRWTNIRLSLVVPTYNESKNLSELLERLSPVLEQQLPGAHEILVVDDDSPDRTWEIAGRLSARYPALRVIRRQGERGLSTAVIRGWQAARGEVLAVMDADLQHPPEIIGALWAEAARGADLVIGSRHTDGGGLGTWSLLRRAVSSGARLLGLVLLPSVVGRVSDPMSGCFMVKRSALADKPLRPIGYKILLEILARGVVRSIREVGYVFQERTQGESKISLRVYLDYVTHLLRLRLADGGILRFARFAAVGTSGVVVDMALLFALSDPRMLAWHLTLGKLVAAEVAIVNNFAWNDAITFRDLADRARGVTSKLLRFLKFNAICGTGLVLHVVLLNVQVSLLGLNRYFANAVGIGLVAMWNYWLCLKPGWRVASPTRPERQDTERPRATA